MDGDKRGVRSTASCVCFLEKGKGAAGGQKRALVLRISGLRMLVELWELGKIGSCVGKPKAVEASS